MVLDNDPNILWLYEIALQEEAFLNPDKLGCDDYSQAI
jgi:hypothetical protein